MDNNPTGNSGEFWHRVLTADRPTTIPRWALEPVPGTAEHEVAVPDGVVTRLRRQHGSLGPALLAAHARVLAALSGEQEVTTGYVIDPGGRPLPCRLAVSPGSWRVLLRDARRAESELMTHRDFPVHELRHELGMDDSVFESVCDPVGGSDELPEGTALCVGTVHRCGRLSLRLRYRTDVLDGEAAARIAGYHLTALAEPERHSLLSEAELRCQMEGLAGPHRELPDRRVHELFEERAAAYPDAAAAVHGERQWTYDELNSRANRIGRALLARGLRREGVVAVVTERNLDWMAAVLGVFKAGGVYLPVEPHFPAERIAAMLARAGCDLVLTERGSTVTLDQVPSPLRKLRVEDACAEGHASGDLGVPVAARDLAYIYFTSGSTGEPKGAMCEHAGFLNHVLAKLDDLRIGPGDVVAQTAPQCFDISLWQLVSALLAGGRTLIVGQKTILDLPRFVDTIVRGRVNVLQVVPSYLDAMLAEFEQHPRELPDLRCVSVTGEAVKKELVQRWFTARPGVRLVNAYGLTETSDDTNHEVMDRVPDRERVPLGRPIANVRAYVVDEHLRPVPLGAPGEIVFSGVCVGRGYVNDSERTRQAFTEDPYRPGERLYRSGDHGRWLPDGKLEFLGRRDSQVKVRGFRVEIGEVENALLRVPGVGDGAVVVWGARLVAFCTGPEPVASTQAVRERLAESLPPYMVPSVIHWCARLPLTANGKTDRRTLTALAGELDAAQDAWHAPRTSVERRLADAWSMVLGIPVGRIGRHDHFFDRGGTSLSAVKLVIALDRAITHQDVTRHPVLADLARLVDSGSAPRDDAARAFRTSPDPP